MEDRALDEYKIPRIQRIVKKDVFFNCFKGYPLMALIPGSSFPSIYSIIAPPPVDT